jgi:hypothetical protein
MTTFIKEIPELSVNGFDGAARRAVRSLGDPRDWKRGVVKEIKKLQVRPSRSRALLKLMMQTQHSSVGDWLDTDPEVVDDVLQKPDDKAYARNWRQGFRAGLALLLESIPLAVQECQAVAPLFEDGIFLSLGLLIQELEKVFVKIMVRPAAMVGLLMIRPYPGIALLRLLLNEIDPGERLNLTMTEGPTKV